MVDISPLAADVLYIPWTGGTVRFHLEPGPDFGHRNYCLLGGVSGTSPGTTCPGGTVLPLNWDFFTDLVLSLINTTIFTNFLGTLDTEGKADAWFNCPPLPSSLIGLQIYFAYTLYNPFGFVSNPVTITITS